MTPKETEAFLKKQIARNEKNILAAIRKLENRVVELSANIEVKADGSIVGPSRSLAQTKTVLKQTNIAFDEIYGGAVESNIAGYSAIDKIVQETAGVTYQGVTVDTLLAQISLDRSYSKSLSNQTQDNLNSIFLDHAINGKTKSALIDAVRGALTGSVDTAGRPMASHAKTISQDGIMEYHAVANDRVLPPNDNDKFKYYGSLIKDSRPWCIDHVGETFTRKEIAEFDNDSWAGKKSGSTMHKRGGYNCQHNWLRIISADDAVVDNKNEFIPAKTIKEAEQYVIDNNLADYADFKGIDVRAANEMNRSLQEHIAEFPELRAAQKFIGTGQAQNKLYKNIRVEKRWLMDKDSYLQEGLTEKDAKIKIASRIKTPRVSPKVNATSWKQRDVGGVAINKTKAKDFNKFTESLENDVKTRWSPENSGSVKALIDHEMGHQLDDLLELGKDDVIKDLFNTKLSDNAIGIDLSRYAETNIDEFIAEGWSEFRNNPQPRFVSKIIGDRINEKYKNFKGN
jgi:hypothetical protein